MKIGFQTNVCGLHIENLEYLLDLIANAGYQGVEFAQRADQLGINTINELLSLLEERNLSLISIAGGTLRERVDFCDGYIPVYLYVEHWDLENISYATERGHVVAFHPRVHGPSVQLNDMEKLCKKHDELKLILDSAHIELAGNEPIDVITQLQKRIASCHFADWRPDFGRSNYRYARGFVPLGDGDIDLESVLRKLHEIRYNGWLIAEINNPNCHPEEAISLSAKWLRQHDLILGHSNDKYVFRRWSSPSLKPLSASYESEAEFRSRLMAALSESPDDFYRAVAEAINYLFACKLIQVFTYNMSPYVERVTLRASFPPDIMDEHLLDNYRSGLVGIAIERQAPLTYFDLSKECPGDEYGYPQGRFLQTNLQSELALTNMVSLPIYNSGNANAVRLIVNIFPGDPNDGSKLFSSWQTISKAITQTADSLIDKLCFSAVTRVNMLAGKSQSLIYFLNGVMDFIQESLDCEGVAIFLVNEIGDKLYLNEQLSTGTKWLVPESEQYYKYGEGVTGRVWAYKEVFISNPDRDIPKHEGKSQEKIGDSEDHQCIWMPLLNPQNSVIGVVRCTNKRSRFRKTNYEIFSNDDAAILDAIIQAAAPHTQILQSDEIRSKALGKLMHELRMPLVAIRAAADFLQHDKRIKDVLEYNYLEDIWSWSEFMSRLMLNADWFQYSSNSFTISAESTLLVEDIVAPVVSQVSVLLREKGFTPNNIHYSGVDSCLKLNIDRNQFQQVMFNLLSNAIKYSYDEPNKFYVEIEAKKFKEEYVIRFRDWGPGIHPSMKDSVFEETFRTREAIDRDVSGQGFGLWIVQQIINAHGGRITITKCSQPLEFSISLPSKLAVNP